MADDLYVQLIREIDGIRGRMDGHELLCAEHYKNLNATISEVKVGVAQISKKIGNTDGRINRWTLIGLTTVMSIMVGIIGWESNQLYVQSGKNIPHVSGLAPWLAP